MVIAEVCLILIIRTTCPRSSETGSPQGLQVGRECSIRVFSNKLALTSGDQTIGASASASVLQWIFRTDFLYDWLVWSPCSPRDSQESSPAPQFESINSSVLSYHYGPTLTSKHGSESEVAQSCLTLCDPIDCSLPGSSVHGIFQTWILEWLAISFSIYDYWKNHSFDYTDFCWLSNINCFLIQQCIQCNTMYTM